MQSRRMMWLQSTKRPRTFRRQYHRARFTSCSAYIIDSNSDSAVPTSFNIAKATLEAPITGASSFHVWRQYRAVTIKIVQARQAAIIFKILVGPRLVGLLSNFNKVALEGVAEMPRLSTSWMGAAPTGRKRHVDHRYSEIAPDGLDSLKRTDRSLVSVVSLHEGAESVSRLSQSQ